MARRMRTSFTIKNSDAHNVSLYTHILPIPQARLPAAAWMRGWG